MHQYRPNRIFAGGPHLCELRLSSNCLVLFFLMLAPFDLRKDLYIYIYMYFLIFQSAFFLKDHVDVKTSNHPGYHMILQEIAGGLLSELHWSCNATGASKNSSTAAANRFGSGWCWGVHGDTRPSYGHWFHGEITSNKGLYSRLQPPISGWTYTTYGAPNGHQLQSKSLFSSKWVEFAPKKSQKELETWLGQWWENYCCLPRVQKTSQLI